MKILYVFLFNSFYLKLKGMLISNSEIKRIYEKLKSRFKSSR